MTAPLRFPVFKELTIDDEEMLGRFFASYRPKTSELTFTSLFMWRHEFHTEWAQHERVLLLLERRKDGSRYFLPPVGDGIGPEFVLDMLTWLRNDAGEEQPAIERADRRLVDALGDRFHVEPMPEHFDYVYRRKALAELSGRVLSPKRNHINRFKRVNRFSYDELRPEHVPDCHRVTEEWLAGRPNQDDDGAAAECRAAHAALDHFDRLPAQGGVIFANGRIEAFMIGERLNGNTLVTQIEKATPGLPGLFTLMTQQTSERCSEEIDWINRAQDLGIEGLRRSKKSYHPDHLVEKFQISLR